MTGFKQGVNTDGEPLRDFYIERRHAGIDCSKDGRTRQEFADECDINILLARYEKTGVINHFNQQAPAYLDVGEVPDLAEAIGLVERANEAFMTLPAAARREFDNDPIKFVEFAADPANVARMREWGLAAPAPVEPSPVRVEITNPEPPQPRPEASPAAPKGGR